MKYRKFGKNGPEVSEIGFGAWAIGGSWGEQSDRDSLEALDTALDQGVNFIDTAAGYGDGKSERIIGGFLKQNASRRRKMATLPLLQDRGTLPGKLFAQECGAADEEPAGGLPGCSFAAYLDKGLE
jgi:hypothetical protein